MRQLQLFSTTQLATMRDRTASRNYSPERDEFRREHERHRAWGLERRHAERMRQLEAKRRAAPGRTGPAAGPPARSADGQTSGASTPKRSMTCDNNSQAGPARTRPDSSSCAQSTRAAAHPPPGLEVAAQSSPPATRRIPTPPRPDRPPRPDPRRPDPSSLSSAAVPPAPTCDNRSLSGPARIRPDSSSCARSTRVAAHPPLGPEVAVQSLPPVTRRVLTPPRPDRPPRRRPDPLPLSSAAVPPAPTCDNGSLSGLARTGPDSSSCARSTRVAAHPPPGLEVAAQSFPPATPRIPTPPRPDRPPRPDPRRPDPSSLSSAAVPPAPIRRGGMETRAVTPKKSAAARDVKRAPRRSKACVAAPFCAKSQSRQFSAARFLAQGRLRLRIPDYPRRRNPFDTRWHSRVAALPRPPNGLA